MKNSPMLIIALLDHSVAICAFPVPNCDRKIIPNPNRLIKKTTNPPKNGMSDRTVSVTKPTRNCCGKDQFRLRTRAWPTNNATPNDPTRAITTAVKLRRGISGIPISVTARSTVANTKATIAPNPHRAVRPVFWRSLATKFGMNCGLVCKIMNPRIPATTAAQILKMVLKK